MNRSILLIIFCVCISCNKDIPEPTGYIAEGLQEYVFEFYVEALEYGIEVDLKDIDVVIDEPHSGHAAYSYNSRKVVKFSPDSYQSYKDNKWLMKLWVYHELGHYYLNRPHYNFKIGMVPVSVMSQQWFLCSENYEHYYVDELFTNANI